MGLIIQKPANPNNYTPTRQGQPIQLVVIHTEDGFEFGTDSWFANGNSHVSAHYSVALSGEVHQHVSEGDTAWHAGNWQVNLHSIGIEFEDDANAQGVARTDAQYESGAQLIASVCLRYKLPCNRQVVIGHREIPNATHPLCPGNEDVDRLVSRAQQILAPQVVTSGVTTTGAPGFPRLITITLNALRVRTGASTSAGVVMQPTPDGLLHQGQTFTAIGVVAGDDVNYSSTGGAHTNLWLHSSRDHYVWAGGTNYPWQAHSTDTQTIPIRVAEPVNKPVDTVENSQAEWEETFVPDPRNIRLKALPVYAIDMTGSGPIQEVNYPVVRVSGHFTVEGKKYWKGTSDTEGFYGINDQDVQETTSGEAVRASRPAVSSSLAHHDPLGAVIRRLPRFARSRNDNDNDNL